MNHNVLYALLHVMLGCLKAQVKALASVLILKTGLCLCAYSLSAYFRTHKG